MEKRGKSRPSFPIWVCLGFSEISLSACADRRRQVNSHVAGAPLHGAASEGWYISALESSRRIPPSQHLHKIFIWKTFAQPLTQVVKRSWNRSERESRGEGSSVFYIRSLHHFYISSPSFAAVQSKTQQAVFIKNVGKDIKIDFCCCCCYPPPQSLPRSILAILNELGWKDDEIQQLSRVKLTLGSVQFHFVFFDFSCFLATLTTRRVATATLGRAMGCDGNEKRERFFFFCGFDSFFTFSATMLYPNWLTLWFFQRIFHVLVSRRDNVECSWIST